MDTGEAAGRELLDEIDKEGGGFTLSEPSAGPTTPGVNVVPPDSEPLLEATSVLATTSTHRVTPEASAAPTGPATAFETTIDTYLRPTVTALEPYLGTAVATLVVAGAASAADIGWRALTSCGGPCAFRPSVI